MTDRENDSTEEPLPDGVPEPPDLGKVHDLRERMKEERSGRAGPRGYGSDRAKQARDIGAYTIIPMMMVAGPVVGYLLGKGWENLFGGEPWPGVIGLLVGLVAAFRQIFILLAERSRDDQKKRDS